MGLDSIELGCGTGYVPAWLARRGVRPVGLDNSSAQLTTARQLQGRFGLRFPLFHANAEQAPFADASFDLTTDAGKLARQVPGEPVARRPAARLEARDVGVEVTARHDDELLGLVRRVEGRNGDLGRH